MRVARQAQPPDITHLNFGSDTKVRRFTRGIGEVFHLREADVGRPITEIVSLLNYADLQRDVKAVLRKLSPIEREVTLQDTNATFILRIRPYRTVDNVIDGVVLTFVDITDRRAAAEAVRASEARYHTLFDLGPVAVYSCDAQGIIQEFNRRAVELWGCEPAAGDSHEKFCSSFQMFRPDGSFIPAELLPMAEVLSGKLPVVRDAEIHIERPDGSRIVVVANISAVKNQRGEVTGAINCFYDISERKQAEEAVRESQARLHFTLEAAKLGDWDLNLTDDTARRSARHDKVFGYDEPVKEWGFEKFITHVHPEDRPEVERNFRAAVADHTDWHFECRVVWPNGKVHWIAAHGSPYRTQNGDPTHMLGIVSNIDERKRQDEQQELLLREMDHRIKNLFAIIGGVVSLSARSATTPQELVTSIQGRLGAMASAHSLVRPRRLGPGATKSETTLADIVETVLRPHIETTDASRQSRAVIDGPVVLVSGDAVASLAMVLHELATNAAKYGSFSEPGGAGQHLLGRQG